MEKQNGTASNGGDKRTQDNRPRGGQQHSTRSSRSGLDDINEEHPTIDFTARSPKAKALKPSAPPLPASRGPQVGALGRNTPLTQKISENYNQVIGGGTRGQDQRTSLKQHIVRFNSLSTNSGPGSPRKRPQNKEQLQAELAALEDEDTRYGFSKVQFTKEGFCILREHLSEPGNGEDGAARRHWRVEEEEDPGWAELEQEPKSLRQLILKRMIKVGTVKAFLKPREGETLNKRRVLVKWNPGQIDTDESEHKREDLIMIVPPGEETAWFRRNECDHVWSLLTLIYTITLTTFAFSVGFAKTLDACGSRSLGDPLVCSVLTTKVACEGEEADLSDWDYDDPHSSMEPDPRACIWVAAASSFFPLVPPVACICVIVCMVLIWVFGLINDVKHNSNAENTPIEHMYGFGKNWGVNEPGSELPEKFLPIGHEKGDIPDPQQCASRFCRCMCCIRDDDDPLRAMSEDLDGNRPSSRHPRA